MQQEEIQNEHIEELRNLRIEIENQIPNLINEYFVEEQLDLIEYEKKILLIKELGGPKLESGSQFQQLLCEYIIKNALRLKREAFQQLNLMDNHAPQNLNEFFYQTLLLFQGENKDDPIYKHQILSDLLKSVNLKIMNKLNYQQIQKLKERDQKLLIQQQNIEQVSLQCPCKNQQTFNNVVIQCKICNEKYHMICVKANQKNDYVCPFCSLLLFNPLMKIERYFINPQYIKPNSEFTNLTFICPKNIIGFQIQLRCVKIEQKEYCYDQKWPDKSELTINEQKIPLFQKNNQLPLGLNKYLNAGQQSRIVLTFQKLSNYYLIALCQVKISLSSELIRELIYNYQNHFKIEESQNQIIKQFQQNKLTKQNKISVDLRCKISQSFMRLPGRCKYCKHFECFDIESFIQFNSNEETYHEWKCSICNTKCYQLMVDDYLLEIIKTIKKNDLLIKNVDFNEQGQLINENVKELLLKDEEQEELLQIEL